MDPSSRSIASRQFLASRRSSMALRKPKLAVWKFSSCDGCQLSLLDCEDELLAVADAVEIANFPEASRAVVKGPYDLSLVEAPSPRRTTPSASMAFGALPSSW